MCSFEIQQHQAALEERADHVLPGHRGEVLVLVGEHLLSGIRPQSADRGQCRHPAEGNRSTLAVHLQHVVGPAAEDLDHMAEQRQSVVAHHRFEAAAGRRPGVDELPPVVGAQPRVEHSQARNGLQGRGQPPSCLVEQIAASSVGGHDKSDRGVQPNESAILVELSAGRAADLPAGRDGQRSERHQHQVTDPQPMGGPDGCGDPAFHVAQLR